MIAGNDDLEFIVKQRIAEEQQREAEIKAKAEQEAKAQAQQATETQTQSTSQAVDSEQHFAKAETVQTQPDTDAPREDFIITIRLNQTTQDEAIVIARSLKERFGECVALNKAK